MDRRTVIGLLGAGAAATAGADLHALGRALHRQLGRGAPLRVLDPHQNATVVALCDTIVPATDTPGAVAAQVNEFIDLLLAEWYEAADRDRFLAGLAGLDGRARAAFGKDFVDGTVADRTNLLTALDGEAARWNASPEATRGPQPFYRQIKWLTLFGYYTSEIGGEQEQHYQIVPGRYVPCAPADTTIAPE
ncbi:MAG TPA: gluconate 2-dehydrogenase subunit 3 family protein [Gemmatimonadales bacterium]|nr:gluconate 2-dehydrogenase subunit 3 family protein [Gemmatimonadales bacterium]